MLNEGVLQRAMKGLTFSQREAEKVVGSRTRLFRLIGAGVIRAEKRPADKQNGRWYCNAYDVILHAE